MSFSLLKKAGIVAEILRNSIFEPKEYKSIP